MNSLTRSSLTAVVQVCSGAKSDADGVEPNRDLFFYDCGNFFENRAEARQQ